MKELFAFGTSIAVGIALILAAAFVSIVYLIPYVVETWAMWFHNPLTLSWLASLLIFIILGIITKKGSVYTIVLFSLITWVMQLCGFTGV